MTRALRDSEIALWVEYYGIAGYLSEIRLDHSYPLVREDNSMG